MPSHVVIEGEKSRHKLYKKSGSSVGAKARWANVHDRLSAIIAFESRRFMTDNNLKIIPRTDGSLDRESWRPYKGSQKLVAIRVIQQLVRDNDDQKSIEKALGLERSLADSFVLRTMLEDRIERWGQPSSVHGISPAEWESAKTLPNWTPVISVPSTCQEFLTLLQQVQSSVVEYQDEEEKVQDVYNPSIWHELQTLQPVTAILPSGSDGSKEQSLGGSHSSQHHGIEGSESSVFTLKDTPCIDKIRRKPRANAFEHRTGREDDILRLALLQSMKYSDIREHHLPNRTVQAIAGRVRSQGLKDRTPTPPPATLFTSPSQSSSAAQHKPATAAPELDQLAHPSFTQWTKQLDDALIHASMSNKYKDLRELQKAIFPQKSYGSIKKRLFHLKQSRPVDYRRRRRPGLKFVRKISRAAL